MAKYKLLVTADNGGQLQWAEKNGQHFNSSERNISFLVESNYNNEISTDEFLKQTGLTWRKNYGKPSVIRNCNGWTIKVL